MKSKIFLVAIALTVLSSCGNGSEVADFEETTTMITTSKVQNESVLENNSSSAESVAQTTTVVLNEMEMPKFSCEILSENTVGISIQTSLENVDKIRVYKLLASSENELAEKNLVAEISAQNEFEVDTLNVISTDNYENNVGELKAEYYAEGLMVEISNEDSALTSEVFPTQITIDTGTINQYNATLAGATSCGASAGMLIIQAIDPVWDSQMLSRLNTIRDYSALSEDYSIGPPEYYLSGEQISNSVNKYLSDNNIENFSLTDFRTEKSTENTLCQLISTGRPSVLEVCYGNGNVLSDFAGYSHWICVNGFRLTENGYEFRYEDTISLAQNWLSSDFLDRANKNVSYGGQWTPTRYISSIKQQVTKSFF